MAEVPQKRPFERRGGCACDKYVSSSGVHCRVELPIATLGEAVSDEERASILEAVRTGDSIATRALPASSSPEQLEALLAGIEQNIAAPARLLPYLADARVAPAIISAASAFALGMGSNHYQVVAMIGGATARDALRERAHQLAGDERCWIDDPFFNALAGELAVIAGGLLRLDAESLDAADWLVRLTGHPCEFNRSTALNVAAGAFDFGLRTQAMLRIRSVFESLDLNASDREFASALPVLLLLRREQAMTRCRQHLFGKKRDDSMFLVGALLGLPLSSPALPLVTEWISSEPDLRVALRPAVHLRSAFKPAFIEDLVGRALASESPSLRWEAIQLLSSLPEGERRRLAEEALPDEPDPALRRHLSLAAT